MNAIPGRWAWMLVVVLWTSAASSAWAGDKVALPEDGVGWIQPPNWVRSQSIRDEAAAVWLVTDKKGFLVTFYVFDLTSLEASKRASQGRQTYNQLVRIDRLLGFKQRPGTGGPIRPRGCQRAVDIELFNKAQREVRIIGCLHPDQSHYYVWRVEIEPANSQQRLVIYNLVRSWLAANLVMLNPEGKAISETLPGFEPAAPATTPDQPAPGTSPTPPTKSTP